jgi:hypothetical protein
LHWLWRFGFVAASMKQLYTINNTLAGRMILGPIIGTIRFWSAEIRALAKGDTSIVKAWAWHIPACAVTLFFAVYVCGIPAWAYLVMFAWPGIAFSLVRSFCEHQAVADLGERTIVVESSLPLSLMFLNNNLHPPSQAAQRVSTQLLPPARSCKKYGSLIPGLQIPQFFKLGTGGCASLPSPHDNNCVYFFAICSCELLMAIL